MAGVHVVLQQEPDGGLLIRSLLQGGQLSKRSVELLGESMEDCASELLGELLGDRLFERNGEDTSRLFVLRRQDARQTKIPEQVALRMADEPASVSERVGLAGIVASGREDIEFGDIDTAAIELDELQGINAFFGSRLGRDDCIGRAGIGFRRTGLAVRPLVAGRA